MMLEQGLRNFLIAAPSIAALVGDRVYGLLRPQAGTLPEVLIQRATTMRQVLFNGTDSLVDAEVQVDCYAMSGEDVWGLAHALRRVLVDYSGLMDATLVDHCTLLNEFPLIDPDPGIIRVTQLYNIWYVED